MTNHLLVIGMATMAATQIGTHIDASVGGGGSFDGDFASAGVDANLGGTQKVILSDDGNEYFIWATPDEVQLFLDGAHHFSWDGSLNRFGYKAGADWGASMSATSFMPDADDSDTEFTRPSGNDSIGLRAGGQWPVWAVESGNVIDVLRLGFPQKDCPATCIKNDTCYDTGGATKELCICETTDTWFCTALSSGQAD